MCKNSIWDQLSSTSISMFMCTKAMTSNSRRRSLSKDAITRRTQQRTPLPRLRFRLHIKKPQTVNVQELRCNHLHSARITMITILVQRSVLPRLDVPLSLQIRFRIHASSTKTTARAKSKKAPRSIRSTLMNNKGGRQNGLSRIQQGQINMIRT
jgi:hypothetical protein